MDRIRRSNEIKIEVIKGPEITPEHIEAIVCGFEEDVVAEVANGAPQPLAFHRLPILFRQSRLDIFPIDQ